MKTFFVIGNPIAHSKSPIIHEHFAKQFKIELSYQRKLCEELHFETLLNDLKQNGTSGANITLPFKENAFMACDVVSERAKLSKAVNTLTFKDGQLYGDNTDGEGLVRDLLYNKVEIQNKKILIIGAGGATRGCIPALLNQTPTLISVTNRTFDKAVQLVNELDVTNITAIPTLELEKDYDIIINGTSSSLAGALPGVPDHIFENATCIYDMFYSDQPTVFLKYAKRINEEVVVIDGLGMLVEQAAEAFRIWFDVTPSTKEIRNILRKS